MRSPACVSAVMHMNGSHREEEARERERERERGASWDTLHLEAGTARGECEECGQFGKI